MNKLAKAEPLLTSVREMFCSDLGQDTGYSDWEFMFFSLPPGKSKDSILKQATTASFHIHSTALIIDHAVVYEVGWGETWVHLALRPLVGQLYQRRMIDDDEFGAVSGMRIGRSNRYTERNGGSVPFCQLQNPYGLIWDRTRAVSMEAGK
jgi:hypothetical protein